MKRRDFTKLSGLALGAMIIPSFAQNNSNRLRILTGQERPALFGDNYNLLKEASESFNDMRSDALKTGIKLYSQSSYRSFDHQKRIWERKYQRFTSQGLSPISAIKEIVKYSTIPGTSRHHWGTDLDIIDRSVSLPKDVLLEKHFTKGVFANMYAWMKVNSASFGFVETYTNDPQRKGFEYEPWHYSYLPLAKSILKEYLSLDPKVFIKSLDINGSKYFTDEFLETYITENIKGINNLLL